MSLAPSQRTLVPFITLALAVALSGCDGSRRDRASTVERTGAAIRATTEPQPTPPAPALPPVDGAAPITADALRAQLAQPGVRGVLINVWASFCGSCRREIPMLLGLREALGPQGLEVALVSADEPSKWPDAVAFAREVGLPLPAFVVTPPLRTFKRAMSPAWRGALPASFLFDAKGTLRHRWEGPVYEHEIAPILQAFLAGENVDGETLPPLSAGRTVP